jgi:uncharacterized membrane protein (DUF106 family)
MSFLDNIFNPVLGPLLGLPPFWTILIITLFITLLVTVVYKYTTNQKEMKQIKDDLKKYQKEMKEQKDPTKMMAIQKQALDLNMKYMMSSFKSTLYTFIPIIIIFAWLNTHIAYYPLLPNQEFNVTAQFAEGAAGNITLSSMPELKINTPTQEIADKKAEWKVSGDPGEYKLTIDYNSEKHDANIVITEQRKYVLPETPVKNSKLKMIVIGNKKVQPFGDSFNLFGWYPGWLATYIILSIALSSLFRKLMKVY